MCNVLSHVAMSFIACSMINQNCVFSVKLLTNEGSCARGCDDCVNEQTCDSLINRTGNIDVAGCTLTTGYVFVPLGVGYSFVWFNSPNNRITRTYY